MDTATRTELRAFSRTDAASPHLDPWTLKCIARVGRVAGRAGVADNLSASDDLIDALAHDDSPTVRTAARSRIAARLGIDPWDAAAVEAALPTWIEDQPPALMVMRHAGFLLSLLTPIARP